MSVVGVRCAFVDQEWRDQEHEDEDDYEYEDEHKGMNTGAA